ncbi:MAG: DUF721 domain-containing protein [Paracoccus denitrificans]|nr:MAG: DUF721 domain-containing protein [Paracoccus denitrificans]PZO83800.1 MAG: DUF721 domain-containing protein [Paracoccus denitrificans]
MARKPASDTTAKTAKVGLPRARRKGGWQTAAALVAPQMRAPAEARGFAVTRLLTNWAEVVGPDLAARSRPVKISHGKAFGGTLTVLVAGADAPLIQMQADLIREKVNACYGFNAVVRVSITQTAATGFAEGQAQFTPARPGTLPGATRTVAPSADSLRDADLMAADFDDPRLSRAIRGMAVHILSRRDQYNRKAT